MEETFLAEIHLSLYNAHLVIEEVNTSSEGENDTEIPPTPESHNLSDDVQRETNQTVESDLAIKNDDVTEQENLSNNRKECHSVYQSNVCTVTLETEILGDVAYMYEKQRGAESYGSFLNDAAAQPSANFHPTITGDDMKEENYIISSGNENTEIERKHAEDFTKGDCIPGFFQDTVKPIHEYSSDKQLGTNKLEIVADDENENLDYLETTHNDDFGMQRATIITDTNWTDESPLKIELEEENSKDVAELKGSGKLSVDMKEIKPAETEIVTLQEIEKTKWVTFDHTTEDTAGEKDNMKHSTTGDLCVVLTTNDIESVSATENKNTGDATEDQHNIKDINVKLVDNPQDITERDRVLNEEISDNHNGYQSHTESESFDADNIIGGNSVKHIYCQTEWIQHSLAHNPSWRGDVNAECDMIDSSAHALVTDPYTCIKFSSIPVIVSEQSGFICDINESSKQIKDTSLLDTCKSNLDASQEILLTRNDSVLKNEIWAEKSPSDTEESLKFGGLVSDEIDIAAQDRNSDPESILSDEEGNSFRKSSLPVGESAISDENEIGKCINATIADESNFPSTCAITDENNFPSTSAINDENNLPNTNNTVNENLPSAITDDETNLSSTKATADESNLPSTSAITDDETNLSSTKATADESNLPSTSAITDDETNLSSTKATADESNLPSTSAITDDETNLSSTKATADESNLPSTSAITDDETSLFSKKATADESNLPSTSAITDDETSLFSTKATADESNLPSTSAITDDETSLFSTKATADESNLPSTSAITDDETSLFSTKATADESNLPSTSAITDDETSLFSTKATADESNLPSTSATTDENNLCSTSAITYGNNLSNTNIIIDENLPSTSAITDGNLSNVSAITEYDTNISDVYKADEHENDFSQTAVASPKNEALKPAEKAENNFQEENVSKLQLKQEIGAVVSEHIEDEYPYKFYGCFTPYGAKCRPQVYGFRGPLHVWNEEEGQYTLVHNDKVTVVNSRARQIPFTEGDIHQVYIPKTCCKH